MLSVQLFCNTLSAGSVNQRGEGLKEEKMGDGRVFVIVTAAAQMTPVIYPAAGDAEK